MARIERIKSEQLKCNIPFDNQTMDHIGALIGAYLELSMENYRQRYPDNYNEMVIQPNVSNDSLSKLLLRKVSIVEVDPRRPSHSL